MEGERRRVLVLAYYFPPVGGAGVQRTLKFVKYLSELGWDASVVTSRSRAYEARDPSLVAEVPSTTRVVRTLALPIARYLAIVLYHVRLKRLRTFLLWPDGGLGWMPFAFFGALRAARRDRPDVLLSTSSPHGAHLVALAVARMRGLPWLADFRDEWAENRYLAGQPRLLAALSRRAERAITRRAKLVVAAADYFELEGLARDDPRRFVIVNGVDEADFTARRPALPEERFVLAHVGSIYEIRDPSPALRALARLVARGAIDGDRLEVRFVGNVWIPGFEFPPELGVQTTGYVSHARAIEEMTSATALLLYIAPGDLSPSGKVFEYLASGRPVLCLAPKGNLARRLVEEWRAGVACDPEDETGIEAVIAGLWRKWEQDGLPNQDQVRDRVFAQYSRRAAAIQLARVLDEARRG